MTKGAVEMSVNTDLAGKRALVTGATRGIGKQVARTLARRGAHVTCVARTEQALVETVAMIEADGGAAELRVADLSDRAAVIGLAQAAGPIDVLVNNAGTGDKYVPITEPDDGHWQQVFEVDFFAPMVLTRELGSGMAARGGGSIINISSVAGQWAQPLMGAYNCAKAALESLTRVTALELGGAGVRANTVAPGVILTELSVGFLQGPALQFFESQTPLGRLGTVTDVAEVVAFLASDSSAYLSGQTIALDGGTLAGNKPLAAALAALQPA
jgi:NAD(P)-dependent dehydrogenase (short-subunit alcohol dehydrogenase family)